MLALFYPYFGVHMDKYLIELGESLSNGLRKYLADKNNVKISEITREDIANEIFDIILAEIDWNLKYKLPEDVDWEFYVRPIERSKGDYRTRKR
jgi:hypothetical protein